jgi:hypothetical protein
MGKYCDEKKRKTPGNERGRAEEKKEIALPGFHIESLRSSGTFTPLVPSRPLLFLHHRLPTGHPPSSTNPPNPPLPIQLSSASAMSSDIKLFIVHNGASSFVRRRKRERERERERERRGEGREREKKGKGKEKL